MTSQTFNPLCKLTETADDFTEKLVSMYNHGAVVSMISIGHQLGIFDQMATMEPASITEIAHSTGLNERYVREWLAVLTTGNVIEYDSATQTYHLPPHHAACLTRSASPANIAVTSQFIPLIGSIEPRLLECFKSGEGLKYCDYPGFHRVMSEDSYQTVVHGLVDYILPLIPGLSQRLQSGIKVMDAGCGAGLALLKLAQRFPNSHFVGYDLCAEAFAETAQRASEQRLTNLKFAACDLTHLEEVEKYDWVTSFDAVHDQASPAKMLANIYRALKPGGFHLMQDIAGSSYLEKNLEHPLGPLLYAISSAHCTPISLGQGGPGLGAMWGEELASQMLYEAGFSQITSQHLEHDPFNVYFVSRR